MGGNNRGQQRLTPQTQAAAAPIWSGGKQIPGAWTDAQRQAGGRWQRPDKLPGVPQGSGENWVKPPAPVSPDQQRQQLARMLYSSDQNQYPRFNRGRGNMGSGVNYIV